MRDTLLEYLGRVLDSCQLSRSQKIQIEEEGRFVAQELIDGTRELPTDGD